MSPHNATVVIFCTPETGHFQALRGVIARVAARGMTACVFTHAGFRDEVIRCGGQFVDLFGKYSLDEADCESRPIPCRYVSFAGHFARQVIADVRPWEPSLIIYETFAVIGPIVAQALGIPYVNVCVNHNPNPTRCLAALERDDRVHVSPQCHSAVTRLRREFGQASASPFSYVSSLSPLLNIYCEPAEFLDVADRSAFEPLAFFGCLPDPPKSLGLKRRRPYFDQVAGNTLFIYVSFGTVVWRYYAAEALAAMQAISQASAELDDVQTVMSLGSTSATQDLFGSLANANVQVRGFVDQCEVLQEADLFVTHHGLNSVHEAIFHRVPMLSYPFFTDQPALARKCQDLGVALPLTDAPRAPLNVAGVMAAIESVRQRKAVLQEHLERARGWELRTMEDREQVMQRLAAFITPQRVQPSLR